ncbi:hypothetical protein [uncultured Secundilactobacillus sp.]|uniref:hypothetical protein n=1 Tax=uncultured Secundilactobacillus sp. TaxID=2813935 RepID=UPI00258426B7|nr:hypothetical protein [uncultured Secundilactobacillus sp.]
MTYKPLLLLFTATLALFESSEIGLAKTYTQTGYGLTAYSSKKFHTVKNIDYFVAHKETYSYSPNYQILKTFQTTPANYASIGGNHMVRVSTDLFLPVSYHQSGDLGNPQSMALTPSSQAAYVMYTKTGGSNTGFVVHYNLAQLRKTIHATDNWAVIRQATNALQKNKNTAQYQTVLANIKVGPTFKTGHGQSLAMNPKNNQLWFVQNSGIAGGYATVQRLSKSTLKPCTTLHYRLRSSRHNRATMGNNLTFDRSGHAYFSSYVSGSHQLKIYQGTLSTRQTRFKLIMQGLANRPGTKNQSIGYNAANNRLYFVSDDSVSSVPIAKLGHLHPSDVHATTFNSGREFEGLTFSQNGHGYLLTNKGAEILTGNFD